MNTLVEDIQLLLGRAKAIIETKDFELMLQKNKTI
jgi:hypothetical protein